MKLIVGLGNPGKKYEHNRHNVGFQVVDFLRADWKFPEFSFNKKFNAEISEGTLNNNKIILAKPQTFMNASGEAVQKILNFYKLTPENLLVIHDDLDIEIGNCKIQENVHSVGHNGVQSTIDLLGTQNFARVRVGVEKLGGRKERTAPGEDFVLQDFMAEESSLIAKISSAIVSEIKKLL